MLRIVGLGFIVLMILGGILFVRQWNSTTPWGTGTGSINSKEVKTGSSTLLLPHYS
jgi:hypothetical protein